MGKGMKNTENVGHDHQFDETVCYLLNTTLTLMGQLQFFCSLCSFPSILLCTALTPGCFTHHGSFKAEEN